MQAILPWQTIWVWGLTILSVGLTFWFLKYTRQGRAVRAVSTNLRAANLMGINAARISSMVYGASAGIGGIGGAIIAPIARTLALEPRLILMDEPASGLNDAETEDLAELLFKIRQTGITIFLVEHDIRLVMGVSDRIVVMNYGRKIAEGPTDEVRNDPDVIAAYLGGEKSVSNA